MKPIDTVVKYVREVVFLKFKEVAGWTVAVLLGVILLLVLIGMSMNKTEQEIKCDTENNHMEQIL